MCWETLGIAAELELWVQGITGIDFLGCPEQRSRGTPAHGAAFLERAAFALWVRCDCMGFNVEPAGCKRGTCEISQSKGKPVSSGFGACCARVSSSPTASRLTVLGQSVLAWRAVGLAGF